MKLITVGCLFRLEIEYLSWWRSPQVRWRFPDSAFMETSKPASTFSNYTCQQISPQKDINIHSKPFIWESLFWIAIPNFELSIITKGESTGLGWAQFFFQWKGSQIWECFSCQAWPIKRRFYSLHFSHRQNWWKFSIQSVNLR